MTLNALPKGLAELETMVKGGEPGEPGGSALGALDALVKGGGPYIGPKGGKWADPQHTISWDEKIHGAGKAGGGKDKPGSSGGGGGKQVTPYGELSVVEEKPGAGSLRKESRYHVRMTYPGGEHVDLASWESSGTEGNRKHAEAYAGALAAVLKEHHGKSADWHEDQGRSARKKADRSAADLHAKAATVVRMAGDATAAEPKKTAKSLPALSALSELTKSKPIPLPTSGKAASIASMRAAQGVDSEGNAKKGGEIPGGLAEGKKPADFPAEALAAGTKVEMEHTKDPRVAEEIAMDHLTEDSSYYTKLARMESGKKPAAAAAKPKSKADRALLKLLGKNPNPKDAKVHALAAKLGMPVDKLEERAYALLADAQKEKSMGTQEMKKGALAALATLTGSDPLEKGWNERSTVYDRWGEYDFNAGKIIQIARDWASNFWSSRPAGVALRARAFRVAERLADLAAAWAALKDQERAAKPDWENETPAQREAREEQGKARWEALKTQKEPLVQEARECDRELLRIRSMEAQQEAGQPDGAQKAMPAWDDLRKSFYESKDVLEWAGRYWDAKFQARAAELAKKLLAYRQKRAKGDQDSKPMTTSSKPDEEDKIIREMHALEIEWLEAEKKKAEKREKVEAASKGLPLEDYRLTPGVDCTHQPHLAVAHAQAVLDSRVRALRDQGVQVGRPGPAPTSRMQKGEDGQIVRLGQSTVLTGGQSDQQAARLADAGRLGAPAEAIPIDRAAGTQVVACPACQGALLKALTVCPHCGVDQHAPRAPREAPATRPTLAVRDGQPRLRPAVAETVTLADLQGRGNG
ncbi:MAG: DUF5661 family protein [Lentisphaeria bacterium]